MTEPKVKYIVVLRHLASFERKEVEVEAASEVDALDNVKKQHPDVDAPEWRVSHTYPAGQPRHVTVIE